MLGHNPSGVLGRFRKGVDVAQRGPEQVAGIREGQILAGKYRVERVLGEGGMGAVVAARHLQLGTHVAIKFLSSAMTQNQSAVARFADEARKMAMISSDHVTRVYDVGALENGAPYMVMEFLEGGDLGAWVRERGPLPIEQAVDFVLQACLGVAEAHRLGIVHRDLKPANLFCIRRSDGQLFIKVLDFGISKATDPTVMSQAPGLSLTKTSSVMGSPLYMSPEQVQSSKSVDTRTDLWSLGVVLFELLTANVPFGAEELGAVLVKIAVSEPASLREGRPEVPPGLEAVVLKCLEKDRNRRYANVAELAMALLPFAPKTSRASVERIATIVGADLFSSSLAPGVSSPAPAPSAQPASRPAETASAWSEPNAATVHKKTAFGIAALVVAGLVATIVAAWRVGAPWLKAAPVAAHATPPSPASAPSSDPILLQPPAPPNETAPSVSPREALPGPASPAGAASPHVAKPTTTGPLTPPRKLVNGPASSGLPKATAAATVSAAAPSAATPGASKNDDCDPNYTIDPVSGAHRFKPWCFPSKGPQ